MGLHVNEDTVNPKMQIVMNDYRQPKEAYSQELSLETERVIEKCIETRPTPSEEPHLSKHRDVKQLQTFMIDMEAHVNEETVNPKMQIDMNDYRRPKEADSQESIALKLANCIISYKIRIAETRQATPDLVKT